MAAPLFQVELVSPERPLFRGEAGSVVAEAHDGEVGILPGHAPMVALLGTGVVRVTYAGLHEGNERFAIRGGFAQVLGRRVMLLVTDAVRASEVDAGAVERELEKAKEDLRHPASDAEFEALLDRRRWCEARLRIAAGR